MTNFLKNIILILAISFLFIACSTTIKEQKITILDIKQDELLELSNIVNDDSFNQKLNTNEFFVNFFRPWKQNKLSYSKAQAMWGFSYRNIKVYLENHRLASQEWFNKQIQNANFEQYNLKTKPAITLKNTNVRVLPTNSPIFYNPLILGEGFPFDYNQNSLLKINTPLIVSHLSKDKAWAYVESHFVSGWVEINSIAFVDKTFMKKFENSNFFISVKEKFPIYEYTFKEYIKVGTIFPKQGNTFIVAKADNKQKAVTSYIHLNQDEIEKMPLKFDSANRIKILNEFLDEPYGWGGLLNNRDCSSFTQDYFSVFGKYLHRNSRAQTTNGKYLNISNLTLEEKKEFIKKNGIPFSTLVYLQGHIMLYIGVKDDEPLVVHNVWSVKIKDKNNKEFRHIIGKTTITTLEPAKELEGFTENSNILKRVVGIVIL